MLNRMVPMRFARTGPLRKELERALPDRPFTIEFWDGSQVPATSLTGPVISVRSPRAVSQLLRSPGELGLGRAYVLGLIEVDNMDAMVRLISKWKPPRFGVGTYVRLVIASVVAAGITLPGKRPAAELKPQGKSHTKERDMDTVRHHYDVSNDFFKLFLDESMTYSCGIFSRGAKTLEEAQETKLDLICRKLDLRSGQRVLDIGCGWGSFAIFAAKHYGVKVLGITLSEPQAQLAERRVDEAGFSNQVQIKVLDYRDLGIEKFDSVSSIGMVEHVGSEMIDEYFNVVKNALVSGGKALIHGITLLNPGEHKAGPFSERYVFPDGYPMPLPEIMGAAEKTGFESLHVEGFQADYAETLRHWADRLDKNLKQAVRIGGEERVRVWRLYLRAARMGFETGHTSVYQSLLASAAESPLSAPEIKPTGLATSPEADGEDGTGERIGTGSSAGRTT